MEKLSQRFMMYFYITMITGIVWQLIIVIINSLKIGIIAPAVALIMMSIVNIIILNASIIHNIKQRFTESKSMAKILIFTLPLLVVSQVICTSAGPIGIGEIGNRIMALGVAEIALIYRIKTIDQLEYRANEYSKCRKMKGE